MTAASATFTITVPWWAYGAACAAVLALIAGGYAAGRADRRDARQVTAVDQEFAPTIDRWRVLDHNHAAVEGAAAWPVNQAQPRWAVTLQAWGQPRPAAYPCPPALAGEPDPRAAEPTIGRATVTAGNPLDWWEQIDAMRAALGHVRWAADVEETGYIPVVKA